MLRFLLYARSMPDYGLNREARALGEGRQGKAMRSSKKSEACETEQDVAPGEAWPLFDRPGFLARRVHQIHVSLFFELCAPFGVTPVQYSLLSALASREEADQTALSRVVALDRTTTTGALKRLEGRGLVRRGTSDTDRRAQSCSLTEEGRLLLAEMEAAARRAHAATVEMLSPEEQKSLIEAMKKIVAVHGNRQTKIGLF
jgi:DNA-binding MarR family transcriptional regulator